MKTYYPLLNNALKEDWINMHKFSFIGLGPVGLCTAVCFAAKGYKVIASEIDKAKAIQIKKETLLSTNSTLKKCYKRQ